MEYNNKDISKEIGIGTIALDEIFNETDTIEFTDSIDFFKQIKVRASKNGNIQVIDEIREIGSPVESEYKYDYNISSESFSLEAYDYNSDIDFKLKDNIYETRIDKDNFSFVRSKAADKFRITYKEKSIFDDVSILIDAYGESKKIERLNIDIRTHKKSTGKVNGIFVLRICPKTRKIDFRHISRKGLSSINYSNILFYVDNELYDNIMNRYNLTSKVIQEIVNTTILASNYWIDSYNWFNDVQKNNISLGSISVPNFNEEINNVVNIVSDLEKDMYFPHLKTDLSSFINEYKTKEKSSKLLQKKM